MGKGDVGFCGIDGGLRKVINFTEHDQKHFRPSQWLNTAAKQDNMKDWVSIKKALVVGEEG